MIDNSVFLMPPVIHIGLPKTATKTLQWRLFANHSEIFYLGRFDGPQFRKEYRKYNACRNIVVKELMDEIAYVNILNPDFERCSQLLKEILAPSVARRLVPVWSWESYSTDVMGKRRQRARNLKRVFQDARILVTVRHPVALIESAFMQHLRRENTGSGARFLKGIWFPSIDEWIEKEWNREVRYHIEYPETIKVYEDLFGRENVKVMVFEELCENSTAFFSKVCEAVGISIKEGLSLLQGHKENSRWTVRQIEALKAIKSSLVQSILFRFSTRRIRRRRLELGRGNVPMTIAPEARMTISEDWRAKIIDATFDRNRWLSDAYGLQLERFGYFHA